MKKSIFYLLMFVLSFGFVTSCSSDDDDSGATQSIVGKWNMTQVGYLMEDNEEFLINISQLCPGKNFTEVEFFADGTFKTEQYEEDCIQEITTGTYSIEGDVLIGFELGEQTGDSVLIKELTSTKLKIYSLDEEEEDEAFILVFARL